MIILLHGPDTYSSRQKLREIIERYRKKNPSGIYLKFFDGKNITPSDLNNELGIRPLFREKKLLVLEGVFSNPSLKAYLVNKLDTLVRSENIILFYERDQITSEDFLFQKLKIYGKCQAFPMLSGVKLRNWSQKEFEKYRVTIEPVALQRLLEVTGPDLWRLTGEIQKLALYNADRRIGLKDVEFWSGPQIDDNIFKTVDAIFGRNKKLALENIRHYLEEGFPALYLFHTILGQLRKLILMRDLMARGLDEYAVLNRSGMRYFAAKKTYWLAKRFAPDELKKIYQKFFEVDLAIKTGHLDLNTALEMLVVEI